MTRRWSENDKTFGPFTVAKNGSYTAVGVMLDSGDDDDYAGCALKLHCYWATLIVDLPRGS